MGRILRTLILAVVIFVGGWLLFNRGKIHSVRGAINLARRHVGIRVQNVGPSQFGPSQFQQVGSSRFAQGRGQGQADFYSGGNARNVAYSRDYSNVPIARNRDAGAVANHQVVPSPFTPGTTLRIASFKIDSSTRSGNVEFTADLCQQFDAVALQNASDLSIRQLVNELNRRGFDYRFVDRKGTNQKLGIIFNQQSVLLDDQHWYTVNDPENLFLHEPLVAWFRARNANNHEAFTFTLANIQLNPAKPDQEMAYLGELFRAIRNDGRGEDDILLAGDFYSNDVQLQRVQSPMRLASAIIDTATNTRNDSQLDNIVFDESATVEYTGESGAYDFMKRFNMTLAEALEVSNRMPVWAEFSVIEGQSPGRAMERYDLPQSDY